MVTINEIITSHGLEDFEIIAGEKGIEREVRTVTVLDAPDGPKWLKGQELILTSAYLFENDDQLMKDYINDLIKVGSSGLGIKMGRFISSIPKEIILMADCHDFPILKIPHELVWTDIISQFYKLQYESEPPYKVVKIEPEMIGSVFEAGKWGTHQLIERLTEIFQLPMIMFGQNFHVMENNKIYGVDKLLHFIRIPEFTLEDIKNEVYTFDNLYLSVYKLPLKYDGLTFFVVMGSLYKEAFNEITKLFDVLSLLADKNVGQHRKITNLYQQFLKGVVCSDITDKGIQYFEKNRGISEYVYSGIILITGENYEAVYSQILAIVKHMGTRNVTPLPPHMFFDESKKEAVVLLEYHSLSIQVDMNSWVRRVVMEIDEKLIEEGNGIVAVSNMYPSLSKIIDCYGQVREEEKIGPILWNGRCKFTYDFLLVYILLNNNDLLKIDFSDIERLKQEDNVLAFDGILTVETYIECKNYKFAASKLYIHENTLRYRIQKISQLLNLNLEDPVINHNILQKIKLWKLYNNQSKIEDKIKT